MSERIISLDNLATFKAKADETYASTNDLSNKQDTLVSGTNIKTVNGQSILGSGDIDTQGIEDLEKGSSVTYTLLNLNLSTVPCDLPSVFTSITTVQQFNSIFKTNLTIPTSSGYNIEVLGYVIGDDVQPYGVYADLYVLRGSISTTGISFSTCITGGKKLKEKPYLYRNDLYYNTKSHVLTQSSATTSYFENPFKFFIKYLVEITWSDLKKLRDTGGLIPGRKYRITDYTCTTTQSETSSAGHVFDIIVVADSVSVLNENARAALHAGDTYFANSDLAAWELKYCLDNDTARFAWADSTNGKGVIYRLIDEFFNDVPYDFKNVQFKRYKVTQDTSALSDFDGLYYGCKDISGSLASPQGYTISDSTDFTWCYTFNGIDSDSNPIDMSIQGNLMKSSNGRISGCYKNVLGSCGESTAYPAYADASSKMRFWLGNNVFQIYKQGNQFFYGCYANAIAPGFYCNTIGEWVYSNTIGTNFKNNAIDDEFYNNVIGDEFENNTIARKFSYNSIGYDFYDNTISPFFQRNTTCPGFHSNTIGEYSLYNTICSNFINNTLGDNFQRNTVGNNFGYNAVEGYVRYCKFDDGVQYISLTSDDTSGSYNNYIQNVHIHSDVKGVSTANRLVISAYDRNLPFEVEFYLDDSGNLMMSNFASKITWSALKTLRDGGNLVPGKQYRITDYQCTTITPGTQAANHQFDIIVIADSTSSLNDCAKACKHEGDTYFENTDFTAWELKYSLDRESVDAWWSDGPVGTPGIIVQKFQSNVKETFLRDPASDSLSDPYPYAWKTYNGGHRWTDTETPTTSTLTYPRSTGSPSTYDPAIQVDSLHTSSGKGAIYYMKDEFNNSAPLDFKNILYQVDDTNEYMYTFGKTTDGVIADGSLTGHSYNNIIEDYTPGGHRQLPFVYTRNGMETCRILNNSHNIIFKNNIDYGGSEMYVENSYNISFSTFSTYGNTVIDSHDCVLPGRTNYVRNSYNITLSGQYNRNNIIINSNDITASGLYSDRNKFYNSNNITLGASCNYNIFEQAEHIVLPENCKANKFEVACAYITCTSPYLTHCTFERNVRYLTLNADVTTTETLRLQGYHFHEFIQGASDQNRKTITLTANSDLFSHDVFADNSTEMYV